MSEPDKVPTFLYKDGEARIFHLAPGEAYPEGWHDTPQPKSPEPEPEAPKKKRGRPPKVETEPDESESED
jgi:hypothetical protein